MRYLLTASPAFVARHFPQGLTLAALAKAPAVAFDQRDDMHVSYMARHFGLEPGGYPTTVRSSEAFVAMAEQGLACCLIPGADPPPAGGGQPARSQPGPASGRTALLAPLGAGTGLHKQISQRLIEQGRRALQPG